MPKLCYIYARKSVDTGKGESIENQIALCRKYITSSLAEEAEFVIYTDKGFSGKSINRPEFKKMYDDIKQNRPDYVVCYRLDRISRNVGDFAEFNEFLERCGTAFVSVNEKFDTSSPMGKAMMYITSVFAQLERETIAERVRDNMHMLAKTGRWLGGTAPTGYTAVKDCSVIMEGKTQTVSKLEAAPRELDTVRKMFEKYLETKSISAVSKFLISKNIVSRNGRDYSLPGIKEILQNPVYCIADRDSLDFFISCGSDVCFDEGSFDGKTGLISYNKRDYSKGNSPRQSRDKWIIAAGKHNGIISGKEWVSVQNSIEMSKPTGKAPSKMHNDYSLLSGMIFCSKCGERMFAKVRSGKNADHSRFSYICSSKLRGGTAHCGCPNLIGQMTDDEVCRQLVRYADRGSQIYEGIEKLRNELSSENESPASICGNLKNDIAVCERKTANLISAISSGNAGAAAIAHINAELERLDKQKRELQDRLNDLDKKRDAKDNGAAQLEEYISSLSTFKGNYDNMTIYEKRELVKILVDKITWDGENLRVFIFGK